MLSNRSSSRTFLNAPQSVTSFVAAFLEPVVTLGVLLAVTVGHGEPFSRPSILLAFFVFSLTFPGFNRFAQTPLEAALDIAGAWFATVALLTLCGVVTGSLPFFSWPVIFWWVVLTPFAQWFAVMCGRMVILRAASKPSRKRKVIVIGAGVIGCRVAQIFQEDKSLQLTHQFVGFFDDRRDSQRLGACPPEALLGTFSDLAAYTQQHGIHEVYITTPLGTQPRMRQLLQSIQGTTVSLYFVPDVMDISVIQGRLQELHGIPVVGLCETPFTGINQLVKRTSDVVLTLLILLMILPVMLLIALGIKLTSPGPVIFKQRRNGLGGEEIIVYKFRSMVTTDDGPSIRQATRDDARVTPFGAFLRRTSLDELPQFFNVLQGHMSIVGPRPHAVAHNQEYRQLIKAYMIRHKVKPGITGWAQIHGHRGETDSIEKMQARVEYDLEYLRNWSLALDLEIILKTIRLVFFDRNAY